MSETNVRELSLEDRIELIYDEAMLFRQQMAEALLILQETEEAVRLELGEAWANAKNNDVRKQMVAEVLSDNEEYHGQRRKYRVAKDDFRVGLLEIDRLKLLVELRKAES